MDKLQTQRTMLRRFQLSDLRNMIVLESDPDVMRFTPLRVPQTLEKTEARLKSLIEKEATYAPLGVWAVEGKETSDFVGWFMLTMTEFKLPEVGFMIMKNHWGKGFATEVLQTLIGFGMKDLNYSGIAAVTDYDNVASIHLLEKLGFKKVSTRNKFDKILGREIEAQIFELRQA